ncbi:hypothetical protein C0995_004580 [Termitomyces sp. Mi166|nr:hypothetical protein C0995_004580 [Termitomyces sp. Mi166\
MQLQANCWKTFKLISEFHKILAINEKLQLSSPHQTLCQHYQEFDQMVAKFQHTDWLSHQAATTATKELVKSHEKHAASPTTSSTTAASIVASSINTDNMATEIITLNSNGTTTKSISSKPLNMNTRETLKPKKRSQFQGQMLWSTLSSIMAEENLQHVNWPWGVDLLSSGSNQGIKVLSTAATQLLLVVL